MSTDYIDLGPDDVIREGDEAQSIALDSEDEWFRCVSGFGVPVRAFSYKYRFRRPRSVAIRDAALELLRVIVSELAVKGSYRLIEPEVNNLMQTMGVSVEELREP